MNYRLTLSLLAAFGLLQAGSLVSMEPEPTAAANVQPVETHYPREVFFTMHLPSDILLKPKNPEQAKQHQRALQQFWHPDKNPNYREFATAVTQAVNDAYDKYMRAHTSGTQEQTVNWDQFSKAMPITLAQIRENQSKVYEKLEITFDKAKLVRNLSYQAQTLSNEPKRAFAYWLEIAQIKPTKAIEASQRSAFEHLGHMYEEGNGVKLDYAQAFSYFSKARSSLYSLLRLGIMTYKGQGTPVDYPEALKILLEIINSDLPESLKMKARGIVGDMYFYGQGAPIDYKRAYELYEKTALHANLSGCSVFDDHREARVRAFLGLGKFAHYAYKFGMGIEALNFQKAQISYQNAINEIGIQKNPNLQLKADLFLHCAKLDKDLGRYELAAQKFVQLINYPITPESKIAALIELAGIYSNVLGPQQLLNGSKAIECLEQALQLETDAVKQAAILARMGDIYKNGIGLPKDIDKAIEYYEKAAALSNADFDIAMKLARLYDSKKEYSKVTELLHSVLANPNTTAIQKNNTLYVLGRLYMDYPEFRDITKALDYLLQAAAMIDHKETQAWALYQTGKLYYFHMRPINKPLITYFLTAAKNTGHPQISSKAQELLNKLEENEQAREASLAAYLAARQAAADAQAAAPTDEVKEPEVKKARTGE